MLFITLTATEHVTFDNRFAGICTCILFTDRYHRILFHTANHTTAIDATEHCSVIDIDSRTTFFKGAIGINAIAFLSDHGFLTGEGVSLTLTTAEHITDDKGA